MKFSVLVPCLLLAYGAQAQQQTVQKTIAATLAEITTFERQAWVRDSSNHRVLRSQTEETFVAKGKFYTTVEAELTAINKKSLSFDDQINLELINHLVLDEVAAYHYKTYFNPLKTDVGFHAHLAGFGGMIINDAREAEQYLLLLMDVPRYMDENMQLMRQGIARGITQPKEVLTGYETSYTQHLVSTAEESIFWKPFRRKPASIAEPEWDVLQANARLVIRRDVVGSYQKLKRFFDEEYLPHARPTLGAAGLPNGRAYYEDRVRHFTTTTLTSEQVYQVGLTEVARIRGGKWSR